MGIAESASSQIDYYFKTRARKPLDEMLRIQLPGFTDMISNESFSYSVNVQSAQLRPLVDRSVFFE
jgi:hypothetical protein